LGLGNVPSPFNFPQETWDGRDNVLFECDSIAMGKYFAPNRSEDMNKICGFIAANYIVHAKSLFSKGFVLSNVFPHLKFHEADSAVVFVDDMENNVFSVGRYCQSRGIPYLGLKIIAKISSQSGFTLPDGREISDTVAANNRLIEKAIKEGLL
jgi:hypothetical protein